MKTSREERFELLAVAQKDLLVELANDILKSADVHVVKHPRAALLMLPAKDRVAGGLFYAGEVLVMEAEAEVNGQKGYSMSMIIDEERALAAAIVDAAAEDIAFAKSVERLLSKTSAETMNRKEMAWRETLSTKVDFQILDK